MGSVYSSSYLTISASTSTDDSTGCFPSWGMRSVTDQFSPDNLSLGKAVKVCATPRILPQEENPSKVSWYSLQPFVHMDISSEGGKSRVYITTDWLPNSGEGSKRMEYYIPSFGCPVDPLQQEPLSGRAWTLQERLLSPRTLHLGMDQMFWECKGSHYILGEDGSRCANKDFSMVTLLHQEQQPCSEHGIAAGSGISLIEGYAPVNPMAHQFGRWDGGWLAHIESYSKRKLTKPDDKLPALSGIAGKLAQCTGDTYYAGLWEGHILEDLAWRVYAREEFRVQVPGGFAHSYGVKLCDVVVLENYRAPSWSWASLDAPIRFIPLDFSRIVAEFIHCHTELAGTDPFGKVNGGGLKLWVSILFSHLVIVSPGAS
jgi:hypothetical protein